MVANGLLLLLFKKAINAEMSTRLLLFSARFPEVTVTLCEGWNIMWNLTGKHWGSRIYCHVSAVREKDGETENKEKENVYS